MTLLRALAAALLACHCAGMASAAPAKPIAQRTGTHTRATAASAAAPAIATGLDAEARLIQIYQRIGAGQSRPALLLADKLVADYPNFALAQLVHGDLLQAQSHALHAVGDVPEATARAAAPGTLGELREEALQRLKALRERPPVGMVPSQFVRLSERNKHAIAVDASRSRLYLLENSAAGPHVVADYYISVGKLGIEKTIEGDQRTPLGIYFITSSVDRKLLKDFYGAGALPINYPNPYDLRRGKTGGGIWLHGVPPQQFARAPRATDGCVALSNPDLKTLLSTVEIRSTPVVIAPSLQWVNPSQNQGELRSFDDVWKQWLSAKTSGDVTRTLAYYTHDFNSYGKTLQDWGGVLQTEIALNKGQNVAIKDQSVLHWAESSQNATMVVTFSEVRAGNNIGNTKRQYWLRSPTATGGQWKIFFEGVIG
jgi:L,D-transpeptidase YnhG